MPTITASPVAMGIKVSTEFDKINLDSLPAVNYEDIRSGKLAESELKMIRDHLVESPGNSVVLMSPIIDHGDAGGMFKVVRFDLAPSDPVYTVLKQDKEKRPYRTVSAFTTTIETKTIYAYGVAYMNKDGSISILHYAFENIDGNLEEILKKAIRGEYYSLPVSEFYCGADCDPFGWINYSTQPTLKMQYTSPSGQKISMLVDQWVETGNIPPELQKDLLLPLPFYFTH